MYCVEFSRAPPRVVCPASEGEGEGEGGGEGSWAHRCGRGESSDDKRERRAAEDLVDAPLSPKEDCRSEGDREYRGDSVDSESCGLSDMVRVVVLRVGFWD